MKKRFAPLVGLMVWGCSNDRAVINRSGSPLGGSEATTSAGGTSSSEVPGPSEDQSEDPPSLPPPVVPSNEGSLPVITGYPAGAVQLGDIVEIQGEHFLPNPRLIVAEQRLVPISATDVLVRVEIPNGLALPSCSAAIEVLVENDLGASSRVVLTLSKPPASFGTLAELTVPAGDQFAVPMPGVEVLAVTLGGQDLSFGTAVDGTLSILLPVDTPAGATELEVEAACGADTLSMTVLAPRPRIVSVEPRRLAVGGVTFVQIDGESTSIEAAALGGAEILPSDVLHFAVSPYLDQVGAIAIRVPEGLATGALQLRVASASGSSDPADVTIVPLLGPYPPAPDVILFSPEPIAYNDTFPVGVNASFGLTAATEPPQFEYAFSFPTSENFATDPTCGSFAPPPGTVGGVECYLANPGPDTRSLTPGAARCSPGVTEHPIRGEFQLSSSANWIDITIDRTPSGGVIERYVGGWFASDGASIPGELPVDPEDGRTLGQLLLTSMDTGLQLRINHRFFRCPVQDE